MHPVAMALDDRTAQEQLTPEERRELLRAFADRMLLKVTAMDDPEDMPGVEKAMRVAAVIERVYNRCDRAERQYAIRRPIRASSKPSAPPMRAQRSRPRSNWPAPWNGAKSAARVWGHGGTPPIRPLKPSLRPNLSLSPQCRHGCRWLRGRPLKPFSRKPLLFLNARRRFPVKSRSRPHIRLRSVMSTIPTVSIRYGPIWD